MALHEPPRCPDDAYVNERRHELLRARIDDAPHVTSALSLYIRRIHLGKLASPALSDTLHVFPPGTENLRSNLPIHQDYPYLMQSPAQITVW
jgi:hypothetical protein